MPAHVLGWLAAVGLAELTALTTAGLSVLSLAPSEAAAVELSVPALVPSEVAAVEPYAPPLLGQILKLPKPQRAVREEAALLYVMWLPWSRQGVLVQWLPPEPIRMWPYLVQVQSALVTTRAWKLHSSAIAERTSLEG